MTDTNTNYLQEVDISCPYCGETISLLADRSIENQQYIEDCQVCCKPISILLKICPNGHLSVEARHEDEA
ncbi:MAG: CPXCG motif-containing cysteine-rich protein [Gammaproteobacteria bacterium]|jgi:hypothetical protein|nr:CPXCG motif-containing cysteine-rich protein [Gammaproteobacteria bacterium]